MKHVLLIGTVGFFISAVVFLYLAMTRKKASVAHSLTFLSTAIAALAYYSIWNGLAVQYKTSDITPRVIFWPRHLDQIITVPVCSETMSRFLFVPLLTSAGPRLSLEILASSRDQIVLLLSPLLARESCSPSLLLWVQQQ